MELLYICTYDLTIPQSSGVAKKINDQISAFEQNSMNVTLTSLNGKELLLERKGKVVYRCNLKFPYRANALKKIEEYIITENKDFEAVYCRYPMADPALIHLLNRLDEKNSRIIMEFPTYPYEDELKTSFSGWCVLFLDWIYRGKMKKSVERIACIGWDKPIYGIPVTEIVNGADIKKIRPRNVAGFNGEYNIIAVAGVSQWHGYDRLILGLQNYYNNGGNSKVYFHIVGEGNAVVDLKQVTKSTGMSDYVFFYGARFGQELDEVYDKANIAVSGLRYSRFGITTVSSLKSREYMAKGLPIITEGRIDVIHKDEKYVYSVSQGESPVDISKVVEWYNTLLEDSNNDEHVLAKKLRQIAMERCDIRNTMQKVIDLFDDNE